ncbi:hypothetical protein Hanom_Chr03g00217041 [Helianthus anomalus]
MPREAKGKRLETCFRSFKPCLVPNFFQQYMDGPCGLHFVTHLVPNLDMLKPLDLLTRD